MVPSALEKVLPNQSISLILCQTVKLATNTLEGLEKQLHETETKAHSVPTASVEKPI